MKTMLCVGWATLAFHTLFYSTAIFGQVTWIAPGSGDWETGSNWSTGIVPQPGEDVEIDLGGGNLITIGAAIPSINTLMSEEDIFVDGGDLVMALGGTVNGSLTLGVNSDLTSNGGTFNANGTTVLDGGNVFADGGATMNLATVTSYLVDTGTNSSRTFRANNSSTLNFTGLTTLTGGGFIRTLNVQANGNSLIDMSNLTNYTGGSTRFSADGATSLIDISSLAVFNNNNQNSTAWLSVSNGGFINASSLVTLQGTQGNTNRLLVDGATSIMSVGALTNVLNSRVQFTNGGVVDLSGVTNFDGSDALVSGGVTMDLTGVTSYDTNTGGNQSRLFRADGASSVLDLSNLATVEAGSFIRRLNVESANMGEVNLSGLTSINSGAAQFVADGSGSLIDLSALQSFNDDNGNATSLIEAKNGGEIRLNTSGSSNISLTNVNITLNSGSTLDISRVTSYNGGIITSNGVNLSLAFSDATNASLIANDGATIDASGITGSLENTGNNFFSMNFEANGAGSRLDLDNITSVGYNTGSIGPNITFSATSGGEIDVSGVQSMETGGSFINSNRPIGLTAEGTGSVIDATDLTTFADLASRTDSFVTASNDGEILLADSGTTTFTNVNLTVNSGGKIVGDTFELISVNTNSSGDPDDFSTLAGDGGTIEANVVNTSGIVSPGLSVGSLIIDGDFQQAADGDLILEIESLTRFDFLNITGDAQFGGDLLVSIDGGFDLQADQDFLVIEVDGSQSGFFSGLTQGSVVTSDNGFDLKIDYFGGDGNDVRLTTGFVVPEPTSAICIAFIFIGGLATARRRVG